MESLAKALSFADGSTIYRWLRGEKTPSVQSQHIDLIINYLKLKPAQAERLRNAQVYSLRNRMPREPRKPRKRPPRPRNSVSLLIVDTTGEQVKELVPPGKPDAEGVRIMKAMIQLLRNAPAPGNRSEEDRTITLTWQSRDTIAINDELQEEWEKALRQAMRQGWRIRYLCRLDHNLDRTVKLVHMMRALLSMGNYFPRYFTSYGALSPTYDLLIVPRFGAVVLFAANRDEVDAGGIIISDQNEISLLQRHARLLAAHTTPLIIPYSNLQDDPYAMMIHSAEARRGGRLALKDGLSTTTQPEEWFTDSPIKRMPTTYSLETWEQITSTRGERIATFKRYLAFYDFYDICTMRAIEKLAFEGVYPTDDPINRGPQPLHIRLEHLRNVVDLLNKYPHYHLGLVPDCQVNSKEPNGIPVDVKFAITADNSVFLSYRGVDSSGRSGIMGMRIREPTVAAAFTHYFEEDLWKKIPENYRERKHVIEIIERYIKEIERELKAETEREAAEATAGGRSAATSADGD